MNQRPPILRAVVATLCVVALFRAVMAAPAAETSNVELPPDWAVRASIPILDRCLQDVEFLKAFNAQQDRVLGTRHKEIAYRTAVMEMLELQRLPKLRQTMRARLGLPEEPKTQWNDRGEKTFDPIRELRTPK